AGSSREEVQRPFRIPFDHGLHVRPAALVAAALKPFACEVTIALHGRRADARSPVTMMSLGARCGDTVVASASGVDAAAALDALATGLAAPAREAAAGPAAASIPSRIEGVIASRGVAIGTAVQWAQPEIAVTEAGRGESAEREALSLAVASVREHLEARAA